MSNVISARLIPIPTEIDIRVKILQNIQSVSHEPDGAVTLSVKPPDGGKFAVATPPQGKEWPLLEQVLQGREQEEKPWVQHG
jgi:hypothetical protein